MVQSHQNVEQVVKDREYCAKIQSGKRHKNLLKKKTTKAKTIRKKTSKIRVTKQIREQNRKKKNAFGSLVTFLAIVSY